MSDVSTPESTACEAPDCTSSQEACPGPEARTDGGGQPCPAPLQWHQVLESFRAEARSWRVERAGREILGRTFGQGPPLYFLNGIGGDHELFSLFAWVLRDSYRCVFLDYAPPTKTVTAPRPEIPPPLASLAEDLFAVADHHGDTTFAVYGTSFGGAVALAAMARRPERIERAVLQGSFARLRLSVFERLAIRLASWSPGRVRHLPLRNLVQRQSHLAWFPPFDHTRYSFFADNTGCVPIRRLAGRGAAVRDTDLRPLLPEIRTPILLLRSEGEGRVSTAAHDELKAGLPNARSEWMFGCGHLPYLTHPHRLAKLVTPFLTGESQEE